MNKRQREQELLSISSRLWDELTVSSMPATASALWKEHQHIRHLIATMDKLNPIPQREKQSVTCESRLRATKALTDAMLSDNNCTLDGVAVECSPQLGDDQLGLLTTRNIQQDEVNRQYTAIT